MFYILESQHHKLAGMISYPDSGWGLDFTKGKLLDPRFGEGGGSVSFLNLITMFCQIILN